MKLYSLSLFVCLLLASCSRQPVRVEAPLPGSPAPASPAPAPSAEPANETTDRMNEPMTAPPTKEGGEEALEPTATDPITPTPPTTQEATNGTASIENQGSIGQLPLNSENTDADLPNTPLMTLSMSPCNGDCDVFSLQLLPGNLAILEVSKGLMGKGNYQRQLDDFRARELTSAMNGLRSEIFQQTYPVGEEAPGSAQFSRLVIPDKEGNLRSINVYYGGPASLTSFIRQLNDLIDTELWKPREYARE